MKTLPPRHPNGFTLIELLIAVALLAILALLVAGTTHSVLESSRRVKCVNRLRQITTAYLAMTVEHGGKMDTFRSGTGDYEDMWNRQLVKGGYITDLWLFVCPSTKPPAGYDPYSTYSWSWTSYGLNMVKPAEAVSKNGGRFKVNYRNIEEPSQYFLIADTVRLPQRVGSHRITSFAPTSHGIYLAHGGRMNLSFLDGHIESLRGRDLESYGFTHVIDQDFESTPTRN